MIVSMPWHCRMSDNLLTTMAILTTTCRQILCHRWLWFIHDQILMIYHKANLSENEASVARGQGRGQISRGRDQKNWPWGGVGFEDLTSLLSTQQASYPVAYLKGGGSCHAPRRWQKCSRRRKLRSRRFVAKIFQNAPNREKIFGDSDVRPPGKEQKKGEMEGKWRDGEAEGGEWVSSCLTAHQHNIQGEPAKMKPTYIFAGNVWYLMYG